MTPKLNTLFRAAIPALFLTTAAASAQNMPLVPIDQSFSASEITFESQRTKLVVAWGSKNVSGKLAVCGAYWVEGKSGTISSIAIPSLRQLSYELNGKSLGLNASYFRKRKASEEIKDISARCRVTNVKWQDGFGKRGKGARLADKKFTVYQ